MSEPRVTIEKVTPNQAADWLKRNFDRNRPYRERDAMQYAADMAAGHWRLSDQAVTFNTAHELVNGRHRLEAILMSDCTITSLVLRCLPDESVMSLDGGKKRTTDDNLHMAGYDYPKGIGGTMRRAVLGVRTTIGRKITDTEVADFLRGYGNEAIFAHRILPCGRFASVAVRAIVTRAAVKKHNRSELERFCETLDTGFGGTGSEAAVALRNYIMDDAELGGGSRVIRLYQHAEAALRAFLNGDRTRKLKPESSELFPVPNFDNFPNMVEEPRLSVETA